MKAILFARVSQESQAEEGFSLPSQVKLLTEYAQRNNFKIVETIAVPESASGTKTRKVFNQLVDRLITDKSINCLLVEKVDRISRNLKDAVRLDDWLREDPERQIHFVKQNLIVHKNAKSYEVLQWDMYLIIAKQYVNNLKEEVAKGCLAKAEEGYYPGSR